MTHIDMQRVVDAIQFDTVALIVDAWPTLPPRPVTSAEGELLNAVLLGMLARLRAQDVMVPDVGVVRVGNVEAAR